MKLYDMFPTYDSEWNHVEGVPTWMTPPVKCDTCNNHPAISEQLPCVDLSQSLITLPGHPVSPEVFQDLSKELLPYYPIGMPILSSQGLGPLKGKVRGTIMDMACIYGEGVRIIKESALEKICAKIETLKYAKAYVKAKNEPDIRIYELQADGLVQLASNSYPLDTIRYCPRCGLNNIKEMHLEWIKIRRSTIPNEGNIYGIREFSFGLFVSEQLREIIEKEKISGVRFAEIPMVDE